MGDQIFFSFILEQRVLMRFHSCSTTRLNNRRKRRKKKRQQSGALRPIRHLLGFDPGSPNAGSFQQEDRRPTDLTLVFLTTEMAAGAWWRAAHPGSTRPNSPREMRPWQKIYINKQMQKPRKRRLWKASNVQQRSYIGEFIYKPRSIFKHKLGSGSGQI